MNQIQFIIIYTGYDYRLTKIHTRNDMFSGWSGDVRKIWSEIVSKYTPMYLPPISASIEGPDTSTLIIDQDLREQVEEILKKDPIEGNI